MLAAVTPLEIILIISTLLEFNPLFQVVKSIKTKNVEGLSIYTFSSITLIGALWLYYGIIIQSLPLIIGNGIKLFAASLVVIVYLKYKK
jgi:MtN3 and saliva related transmembrane protein